MTQLRAPTPGEVLTVIAARALPDRAVCFVGIGLPSAAANLARLLHAPNLVLIYESGTIGSKPNVLPLSIGDGELAETATTVVSVPEIFGYWLQGGRIDVGFLGAAQIDRVANINTTVIGSYDEPQVRLPGAGGAPEIAAFAGEVVVMMKHSRRMFVEAVDFVTSPGTIMSRKQRAPNDAWGRGPTSVVTDLGVLEPDSTSGELTLTALHPGVDVDSVRAATGWPLCVSDRLEVTAPPSIEELKTLRGLMERTNRAHSGRSAL